MTDIIIVGAGTAGLTAAIYAQRAGKSALIFEGTAVGGQIINTPDIENYPGIAHISGFEFATGLLNQATALGAQVKYEQVTEVIPGADDTAGKTVDAAGKTDDAAGKTMDAAGKTVDIADKTADAAAKTSGFTVKTAKNEYMAKAVILATGAKNRPLGLPREQELIGSGISYCATCDGMFFRGRDVAVNGGGNTALEDAAFLANYCSKVYLIHRRDAFRGDEKSVEVLRAKENVEFVLNSTVTAILGGDKVEGVEVTDKNTKEKRVLPVSGLFVAIGQMPENGSFAGLAALDEKGYIVAGEDLKTKTPGVFTAGDCRTKEVRQLTTAASDGAVAALAACKYIDAM